MITSEMVDAWQQYRSVEVQEPLQYYWSITEYCSGISWEKIQKAVTVHIHAVFTKGILEPSSQPLTFPPNNTKLQNGTNCMYFVWTPQEPTLRKETENHIGRMKKYFNGWKTTSFIGTVFDGLTICTSFCVANSTLLSSGQTITMCQMKGLLSAWHKYGWGFKEKQGVFLRLWETAELSFNFAFSSRHTLIVIVLW